MKNPNIAKVLKKCRKENRMTILTVGDRLKERGIIAAPKTIYGWESGQTQPTADTLMALCCIYGIHDVLAAFGYEEKLLDAGVSKEEMHLILAYRRNPEMQAAVRRLLRLEEKGES